MTARQRAVEISKVFRKHLDAFLIEIGPEKGMAWTIFCLNASMRFYNARQNRKLIEKDNDPQAVSAE